MNINIRRLVQAQYLNSVRMASRLTRWLTSVSCMLRLCCLLIPATAIAQGDVGKGATDVDSKVVDQPASVEEQPRELRANFTSTPSVVRFKIGKLKALELQEFKVRLRNDSESPFLPGKVVSSCSCAAATVSTSEVLPGNELDVRIRIAVPNSAGEFGRKVGIFKGEKERLDILLEGSVEMPFAIGSTDFAISEVDRTVVVRLKSNEGELKKDSVKVVCITPGISLQESECDGYECKLRFEAQETYGGSLSTVVVSAANLSGKKFEQQLSLRIRKKQLVELKPRVLRFIETAEGLQTRFFIYGEKSDLAQLNLDKVGEVEAIYADSPADLESRVEKQDVIKLRLLNMEVIEYGIAGTFKAEQTFSEERRCFLRLALRSGEFLDQIYVVIFE